VSSRQETGGYSLKPDLYPLILLHFVPFFNPRFAAPSLGADVIDNRLIALRKGVAFILEKNLAIFSPVQQSVDVVFDLVNRRPFRISVPSFPEQLQQLKHRFRVWMTNTRHLAK